MVGTIEQLREAILSENPTDQQRAAIFSEELEFLLRAAPGSGKTWTSCRRFIWRGANWPHLVGGLALLSFTNVAIREFGMATIKVGRRDLLFDPNYVGTFDSFVERYILGPFGHLINGLEKRPRLFPGPRPSDWHDKKLTTWRDGTSKKRIPVRAWEVIPYPDGTRVRFKTQGGNEVSGGPAVEALLRRGFYTHAQRVYWACKLLVDRPHIARVLARRFPEIIVDEAQDTNAWLLILLNMLRDKGTKITLVGDPDQCIYEFSMADAASLSNLRERWSIEERHLDESFRCNNQIASAVRSLGGNPGFTGCGDAMNERHGAFVVRDVSKTFADGVATLQTLARQASLNPASAAIVCRGRGQLDSIRGKVNYDKLQGKTKELAIAAFQRDTRHDYRGAFKVVSRVVRDLTGDDPLWERSDEAPHTPEAMAVALSIWQFTKDPDRLPPVSQIGKEWIASVREHLATLINEIGLKCDAKLGHHIRKTGLADDQMALPLFDAHNAFPAARQDTIHQVKGESIDAVLVIGSSQFWNSVVKAVGDGNSSEDRRLAYVAMTRARHLLLVALPHGHFDKHSDTWVEWGFRVAS